MCKPCFQKNQLDVAAASGTTCVECGTASQWHKSKDTPGTKICKNCYNKNYYKKKKAASANEK
jgi:nicotinic acid phosphoribosyltransferase